MRDQRRTARLPLCVAATTNLLFGAACGSQGPSADAESANPERPPVNVTAVLLEPQGLTERIELAGELQPWVEVRVSTELGGTVGQVGFDQGDRVEAGQVLARVGSDLHQAALDEAEAGRVEAEALHTKTQKLFEREGVPRQELIRATATLQVAEARVNLARLRLGRSVVRAPISGFAVTRELEPGEVLSPRSARERHQRAAGRGRGQRAGRRLSGPRVRGTDQVPRPGDGGSEPDVPCRGGPG